MDDCPVQTANNVVELPAKWFREWTTGSAKIGLELARTAEAGDEEETREGKDESEITPNGNLEPPVTNNEYFDHIN